MDLGLETFDMITLDKMEHIRLMNRIDTKYLIRTEFLPEILSMLRSNYYVQDISGKRSFDYLTLYYDTPSYAMYHSHQNGKSERIKIRTREYCDSNLCFLEIKTKSNKGLTQKIRIKNNRLDSLDSTESMRFLNLHSAYPSSMLEAKLMTYYKRITLVNKAETERLTIDYDLQFQNKCTDWKVKLPCMTIIELKRKKWAHSLIEDKLNDIHIKPYHISKYCLGTALTDLRVKHNNIKSKILYIHKLTDFIYEQHA